MNAVELARGGGVFYRARKAVGRWPTVVEF
jgi:hypothetical protein